jgi:hypothetical protein
MPFGLSQPESQRDSGSKPRVGELASLPGVKYVNTFNPNGVVANELQNTYYFLGQPF